MTTQTMSTPTTAIGRVRDGVDRLFDSMLPAVARTFNMISAHEGPEINMLEDDFNVYIETELPGVTLDDIELTITNDVLTVAGSRDIDVPADTSVLRRERADFSFERTIRLPSMIEIDAVEATMRHGVLTVTLPKSEESRTRHVSVTQESID